MTFYVLGNGFDLHYGLPTRYCDFKKYLIANGYREIVERVDDLFWRFGHYCPKDIKEWSTFEDMLANKILTVNEQFDFVLKIRKCHPKLYTDFLDRYRTVICRE